VIEDAGRHRRANGDSDHGEEGALNRAYNSPQNGAHSRLRLIALSSASLRPSSAHDALHIKDAVAPQSLQAEPSAAGRAKLASFGAVLQFSAF
jgi:hypothetical protein